MADWDNILARSNLMWQEIWRYEELDALLIMSNIKRILKSTPGEKSGHDSWSSTHSICITSMSYNHWNKKSIINTGIVLVVIYVFIFFFYLKNLIIIIAPNLSLTLLST